MANFGEPKTQNIRTASHQIQIVAVKEGRVQDNVTKRMDELEGKLLIEAAKGTFATESGHAFDREFLKSLMTRDGVCLKNLQAYIVLFDSNGNLIDAGIPCRNGRFYGMDELRFDEAFFMQVGALAKQGLTLGIMLKDETDATFDIKKDIVLDAGSRLARLPGLEAQRFDAAGMFGVDTFARVCAACAGGAGEAELKRRETSLAGMELFTGNEGDAVRLDIMAAFPEIKREKDFTLLVFTSKEFDAIPQLRQLNHKPDATDGRIIGADNREGYYDTVKTTVTADPSSLGQVCKENTLAEEKHIRKNDAGMGLPEPQKAEESMLMRLLMNPTERRLWGRLFGLPDDEAVETKANMQKTILTPVIANIPTNSKPTGNKKQGGVDLPSNAVRTAAQDAPATESPRPAARTETGPKNEVKQPTVDIPKQTIERKAETQSDEKIAVKEDVNEGRKKQGSIAKDKAKTAKRKRDTGLLISPEINPIAAKKEKGKTAKARKPKIYVAERKGHGTRRTEADAIKKPPTRDAAKKARKTGEVSRDSIKRPRQESRRTEPKKRDSPHSMRGFALGSPFSSAPRKREMRGPHSAGTTRRDVKNRIGSISIAALALVLGKKRMKPKRRAV